MLATYKLRCKKFFAAEFYSPSATTFREKIPPRLTRKDAMFPCNIPSLLTDVPPQGGSRTHSRSLKFFCRTGVLHQLTLRGHSTPPKLTRESMVESRGEQEKFQLVREAS